MIRNFLEMTKDNDRLDQVEDEKINWEVGRNRVESINPFDIRMVCRAAQRDGTIACTLRNDDLVPEAA